MLGFGIVAERGMQQAKGKAEAATYIFWDSSFARNEPEHLLAPRSKGSAAKCPTGILFSGRLSKGGGKLLLHLPVLLGERNSKLQEWFY